MKDEMKDEMRVRPGETEDEYIYRICSLHEQSDMIWDDIASIINSTLGLNHTESWARRKYKAYVASNRVNEALKGAEEEKCSDDTIISEGDGALREKFATATDRLAYARLLRQDSRFERFYKYIGESITKLGTLAVPFYTGLKIPKTSKQYIVPIADLHLGANFVSVNNSYSLAEAQRRVELAACHIKEFVRERGLTEITILSLGDLLQGILRISDLKLNETEVTTAFVLGIRLLAGFLNSISECCCVKYIQVCYSNHEQPRYLGTKASELAAEDMGKISFAYLQDVLANNPRVTVIGDPDRDYFEFKIFDFKCFAAHGHQVKNIAEVNKDLANRHRIFYDYVFLAHSHSAKELISAEGEHHDVEILVAPSMIGSDPYADRLCVGSKAAIKIFGFDEKYGHTESFKYILN